MSCNMRQSTESIDDCHHLGRFLLSPLEKDILGDVG